MSKVSILMPAYNAEQYINDAIEGIINQTFVDWELIIVDDCSTDSTGKMCDNFVNQDKRIRVYHNDVNMGISKAKNIALNFAKGEYITFCDDDDYCFPKALEDNVLLIEKYSADIVRWSYKTVKIDSTGKAYEEIERKCRDQIYLSRKEIFNDYDNVHELLSCDWTGLYRKSFLKNYGIEFNSNYKYGGEDTEFNILTLRYANRMVMNSGVYYSWYLRKNHSTTAKRDINFCFTMMEVAEKEYELIKENKVDYDLMWRNYAEDYKRLILNYAKVLEKEEQIIVESKLLKYEWFNLFAQ